MIQKVVLNSKSDTKSSFKFLKKVPLSLMYQGLQRIVKKADNIKENIKENISLGILKNPQGFKDFFVIM